MSDVSSSCILLQAAIGFPPPHLPSVEILDAIHPSKNLFTTLLTSSGSDASSPSSSLTHCRELYSLTTLKMLARTFPFPFPPLAPKASVLFLMFAAISAFVFAFFAAASCASTTLAWSPSLLLALFLACPPTFPLPTTAARLSSLSITIPSGASLWGQAALLILFVS